MLGDSLTGALPTAKALKILAVAGNTEISLSSLQSALRICSATLEETSFYNVEGSKSGFLANRWPMMKSLKKLLLIADGDSCLDLVSICFNIFGSVSAPKEVESETINLSFRGPSPS